MEVYLVLRNCIHQEKSQYVDKKYHLFLTDDALFAILVNNEFSEILGDLISMGGGLFGVAGDIIGGVVGEKISGTFKNWFKSNSEKKAELAYDQLVNLTKRSKHSFRFNFQDIHEIQMRKRYRFFGAPILKVISDETSMSFQLGDKKQVESFREYVRALNNPIFVN